ncbi:MAG: alpha,3-fucosyltransferase [Acidimicrobiales bacterium]|nr:alpha,3-fucosyltransferase [Acidimicrobiales bacterium]
MSRPLLILLHNRFFEDWPELPDCCAVDCRFVTDPQAIEDADAVVFHVPTLGPVDSVPKRPGQLWVAWSLESRVMCPSLDDRAFMSRFDLTMTYERSSDIWYPYFGPGTVPGLVRPLQPRTEAVPVVYLQSNHNDRCDRLAYAGELMRRVRVDSFGPVLRNRPEVIAPGYLPRVELYGRYKFTLAFENSFAPDYVTEKLYEPLVAGSVPVYRGTADVADLAPTPNCFIDANAFGSASDLGAYLNHLDANEDEYLAYHAWRSQPFSPSFTRHLEFLHELPLCRLASAVETRVKDASEVG